ncbi:MAG TPA: ABC transporter permease [Ktedonobacteraceae bacterium]|nr:ABC transporter permease [Ktedonobacteraceae bacterium]
MAIPTEFREESQLIKGQRFATGKNWYKKVVQALRQDPRLWFGGVLLVFILAAIFAPFITPYSPLEYHPSIATQAPTFAHWLGTDSLGRDQLTRIIYGTRISLSIALATILMGGMCGTVLGVTAAYLKGWVDQTITIAIDAILSFPGLVLSLAIVTALGPSIINLALALAFVRIPLYARIARGQALQISAQDFVTASLVSGTPTWKILFRHILPNIFSPLLVQATISISFAILDESALSFIGLGTQPPTPEWGSMITDAQTYLRSDPWMMLGPALTIIIILVSMNLLGDAVRDLLDPRDSRRVSKSLEE